MSSSQRWRHVVAALTDPQRRSLYARVVLAGSGGNAVRRELLDRAGQRQLEALQEAGLVVVGEDGSAADTDIFTTLLKQDAAPPVLGPERFLHGGRLIGLPRRDRDREALFQLLTERVLAPGEELDEATFTGRLDDLAADPVALRRHLVDYGLIDRDPEGSRYRRAAR